MGRVGSLVSEKRALHDGVNQRAHAVIAGGGALDDGVQRGAVAVGDGRAGGVNDEVTGQVAGEGGFVLEQVRFELADVLEGRAVGELAGGIDARLMAICW